MLEMFTDDNPMRGADFTLPADGTPLVETLQSRPVKADRQRVISTANELLRGGKVYQGEIAFSYCQIVTELQNHPFYEKAIADFVLGDPDPLEDLKLRVARQVAAYMLKVDPEHIGLGG